jgi:Gene product 88
LQNTTQQERMTIALVSASQSSSPFARGLLEFSHGNSKLPNSTMIFSLPAGHTCPGALNCLSKAERTTGKLSDGAHTLFRCYAASQETRPSVRFKRWRNLERLSGLAGDALSDLLIASINAQRRLYTERVRWFGSGDCFSVALRDALIETAQAIDLTFYFYTKNLPLFLAGDQALELPGNLLLTASWGGRFDHLIERGLFPRNARVVMDHAEAEARGLPLDFDDSWAYDPQAQAFAHLVHGTQPVGSVSGAAIAQRRKAGQFTGYGRVNPHRIAA